MCLLFADHKGNRDCKLKRKKKHTVRKSQGNQATDESLLCESVSNQIAPHVKLLFIFQSNHSNVINV